MISFPNGYIIETENPEDAFLLYGELNSSGYIAKGFRFEVPNLANSGWTQKNELYTNLQSYLARFDTSKRLQFRYRKDANYRSILERCEDDFQALFHGDHHNLVCVNGFFGGTPQHAAVFGQAGVVE